MSLEKVLPIAYMGKGSIDDEHLYFIDVEFLEDFGIFKIGDKVSTLHVDLHDCYIIDYSTYRNQPFKLEADV